MDTDEKAILRVPSPQQKKTSSKTPHAANEHVITETQHTISFAAVPIFGHARAASFTVRAILFTGGAISDAVCAISEAGRGILADIRRKMLPDCPPSGKAMSSFEAVQTKSLVREDDMG